MNLFKYPWFRNDLIREKALPVPPPGLMQSLMPAVDWIAYRSRRTEADIINLYRDTAYYCANLNARGVARTPPLMYRKTGTGVSVGKNARRLTKSKSLDRLKIAQLKDAGYADESDELDEIISHPFLDLLDKPFTEDDVGMMGRFTFLEVTQLYLEEIGRSYWLIDDGGQPGGPPVQLFPLIANLVEEYKAIGSDRFVDEYRYQGSGKVYQIFKPLEVVPFRCTSLVNPYTGGYGPMQAASDRVGVNLSYMAQTQALLNNRARPDAMISPKDPAQPIGKSQAKKMAAEFKQKYGRQNTGLPMFVSEAMEYTPLTFSPKDMGELAEDENTVKQIARIFDIPESMLSKDANRASASEGRKQHAFDAICPRHVRLESSINSRIMPRYDKSGATFVKFDEPYKEPMAFEAKDALALITAEVFIPDEIREVLGWGPMDPSERAKLEQRRQDELNAAKPPMKPGANQPATSNNSKAINHYRRLIRQHRAINTNGHGK